MATVSSKILRVNFGNSILDNSKKIHIWKRVRPFLRGKKIIVNQILLSKRWYIDRIYTIPKYQKGNWKKKFPPEYEKSTTFQTPSSTLHLEGLNGRFRHTIKLNKNIMGWTVIKSYQCSLERSHAVLIEVNSEFWSRPSLF